MMEAPYLAAFNVVRAFLPAMRAKGQGVIIHVNSPAAFAPWPGATGYSAARWALHGLHEALLQDLAGTGVRSCQAVFGKVDTPYFGANDVDMARIPWLNRFVPALTPQDCARTVLSLAERPRTLVARPFPLGLLIWAAAWFPGPMRWLLRL